MPVSNNYCNYYHYGPLLLMVAAGIKQKRPGKLLPGRFKYKRDAVY